MCVMTITEVRARFQILIGLEIFYGAMFGTNIPSFVFVLF